MAGQVHCHNIPRYPWPHASKCIMISKGISIKKQVKKNGASSRESNIGLYKYNQTEKKSIKTEKECVTSKRKKSEREKTEQISI